METRPEGGKYEEIEAKGERKVANASAIREVNLIIPEKVRLNDLKDNGKLLTAAAINKALTLAKEKQEEIDEDPNMQATNDFIKIKKSDFNNTEPKGIKTDFSLIYKDGQLYAVYPGKKQGLELGEGSEGSVKLLQNQMEVIGEDWAALKVMHKGQLKSKEDIAKKIAQNDLKLWQASASTTQVMQGLDLGFRRNESGEAVSYQIIIPLKSGMDLTTFDQTHRTISPNLRVNLATKIAGANEDLINRRIIHGDTKGANMVLNEITEEISPIDFTSAAIIQVNENEVHEKIRGTPYYIAPEILKAQREYVRKIQILQEEIQKQSKQLFDKTTTESQKELKESLDENKNKLSEIQLEKLVFNEKSEVFAVSAAILSWIGCRIDRGKEEIIGQRDMTVMNFKKDQLNKPYNILETNSITETQFSQLIPDATIRKELLEVLKKGIDKDPNNRPTMKQLHEELQNISNKYWYLPARMKNIAMVDISELRNQINKHGKIDENFLAAMKQFNQVWLMNGEGSEKQIDVDLRKKLKECGINVTTYFEGEKIDELINHMPEHIDKAHPTQTNNYFYLTNSNPEPDNLRVKIVNPKNDDIQNKIHDHLSNRTVTEMDFNKIAALLNKELVRLQAEILKLNSPSNVMSKKEISKTTLVYKERKEAINNWISTWKNGMENRKKWIENDRHADQEKKISRPDSNYTYYSLMNSLAELQKKMTHTSDFKKTASTFLDKLNIAHPKTGSEVVIEDIKESISSSIRLGSKR